MPVLLAIGLAVVLTAFVAYAMAFMNRSVGGGFIGWLGSQIKDTAEAVPWIGEQVVKLSEWLAHSIGAHYLEVEQHAVSWLTGLAEYAKFVAQSTFAIGYDLERFASWLLTTYLPRAIRNLPSSVTHLVHSITTRVVHVERTIVKLPGLTKAQVRAAVAGAIPGIIARDLPYFDWLKRHLKALERILAGAAGAVIGATIPIHKDLLGIKKRVGKLEKSLVGLAAAGLVATALARLGVSWIRCNNWKRLGRGICNLPAAAISDLLGLLTDVLILADICEVVKLLQDAYALVEQPLAELVGDVGGALCHGDFDAPPALELPQLYLWDPSQIAA